MSGGSRTGWSGALANATPHGSRGVRQSSGITILPPTQLRWVSTRPRTRVPTGCAIFLCQFFGARS